MEYLYGIAHTRSDKELTVLEFPPMQTATDMESSQSYKANAPSSKSKGYLYVPGLVSDREYRGQSCASKLLQIIRDWKCRLATTYKQCFSNQTDTAFSNTTTQLDDLMSSFPAECNEFAQKRHQREHSAGDIEFSQHNTVTLLNWLIDNTCDLACETSRKKLPDVAHE